MVDIAVLTIVEGHALNLFHAQTPPRARQKERNWSLLTWVGGSNVAEHSDCAFDRRTTLRGQVAECQATPPKIVGIGVAER